MPHEADAHARVFQDRVRAREAVVAVIGLGYVGLPLARALTEAGLRVIGIDIDPAKIEALKRGESYIRHLGSDWIGPLTRSGRFRPTAAMAAAGEADAILICVPTPLTRHREPDLSFIESTARGLVPHLRQGQLVVLESTVWPGATVEALKPILETSGLTAGRGFFLAFSPEREDPGNAAYSTRAIPKVVGGDGPDALACALALYGAFIAHVVPVSSPATAEAVKLTENIFRAVNIALVNELKIVFSAMGVDIWEVIDAAKTKPFGFMPFYPGPGLGGHCIPIDPFYLAWKAREFEIPSRFVELAGEINTAMPRWVVERLAEALDRRAGLALSRARVLLLGIAYKKNVDDMRESPALKLIELLEARGATTAFHDPLVSVIPPTREHAALAGRRSIPFDADTVAAYDAVLIVADHDTVDYGLLAEARLVVDTRNACARAGIDGPHVVKA